LVCHKKIWGRCRIALVRPGRPLDEQAVQAFLSDYFFLFCLPGIAVKRAPRTVELSRHPVNAMKTASEPGRLRSATRSWRDALLDAGWTDIAISRGGVVDWCGIPSAATIPGR